MTEKMQDHESKTIHDSMTNTEETPETMESQPDLLSLDRLPESIQQELTNIFNGQSLPPLYSDIIAKTIFNADIHPDRFNFLMQNIAKDETIEVQSSAGNEAIRRSLHSKGMIYDLPAWLRDGRISDLGFQKAAQDFIFTRLDLYASDMLVLQYSVEEGQLKKEMDYTKVNGALLIVLMVESPKPFRDYDVVSDRYIHRFTEMVADTGLTYSMKAKTMYVQLDKCLEQFRQGYNAETADHQPDELQLWLSMIADINDESVSKAAENDETLQRIRTEAYNMAQDREVQNMIIQERYNRMDWLTYGNQQRREGKVEGGFDMLVDLVYDGILTVEQAAQKANLSTEDFTKQYLTPASA